MVGLRGEGWWGGEGRGWMLSCCLVGLSTLDVVVLVWGGGASDVL